MTDRLLIQLYEPTQAHRALTQQAWPLVKASLIAGHRMALEVRGETRSTAQNRLLWSALADVARQVEWHGQRLDSEAWKDMATAALKRQRVVPGIDGGFVVLGQRTSKMTKSEMSELVDFIHAFGDQHGVCWSQTSLGRDWPKGIEL